MTEFLKRLNKTDTRTILAILTALAMFSFVGLLYVVPVPKENVALLNTVMPMLTSSALVLCFTFYFGNSKSDRKDENTDAVS